jgi:IS30 family transposase
MTCLLRQYFPKGMDLSNVHQNRLNAVARRLNGRPRKTLEYLATQSGRSAIDLITLDLIL